MGALRTQKHPTVIATPMHVTCLMACTLENYAIVEHYAIVADRELLFAES